MLNRAPSNEGPETLRSCSGCKIDKGLVQISTQITISLMVVTFSSYQLVNLVDCHSQNLYSSLLSLVIGYWMGGRLNTAR